MTFSPRTKQTQIVALAVLFLLGFFLNSLVSYHSARSDMRAQIADTEMPLTSDVIHADLSKVLHYPVTISAVMAKDAFVQSWIADGERDAQQIERYLSAVLDNPDVFTSYFISDATRRYYHPSGKARFVSPGNPENVWYFRARDMHSDYETIVSVDEMNADALVVFVNHRVRDDAGTFLGVTGVGMKLTSVSSLLDKIEQDYATRAYFVDSDGKVVLSGARYDGPADLSDTTHLIDALARPEGQRPRILSRQIGDVEYLTTVRTLPDVGWRLVIERPAATNAWYTDRVILSNMLVALIFTIVIGGLANFTISGYQHRLEKLATIDHLTQAINRMAFDVTFDKALNALKRRSETGAGIMLDIDHFKHINDQYGHLSGDRVLQTVAATIQANIREADLFCRWGGEEFFVFLGNCPKAQAVDLAEKIRHAVERLSFTFDEQPLAVTISAGVAVLSPNEDRHHFIERADQALYAAKSSGRNRVEVA